MDNFRNKKQKEIAGITFLFANKDEIYVDSLNGIKNKENNQFENIYSHNGKFTKRLQQIYKFFGYNPQNYSPLYIYVSDSIIDFKQRKCNINPRVSMDKIPKWNKGFFKNPVGYVSNMLEIANNEKIENLISLQKTPIHELCHIIKGRVTGQVSCKYKWLEEGLMKILAGQDICNHTKDNGDYFDKLLDRVEMGKEVPLNPNCISSSEQQELPYVYGPIYVRYILDNFHKQYGENAPKEFLKLFTDEKLFKEIISEDNFEINAIRHSTLPENKQRYIKEYYSSGEYASLLVNDYQIYASKFEIDNNKIDIKDNLNDSDEQLKGSIEIEICKDSTIDRNRTLDGKFSSNIKQIIDGIKNNFLVKTEKEDDISQ